MAEFKDAAYRSVNHHPIAGSRLDTVGSVLHSVCAAEGCTWVEAYESLIRASGEIGMMPASQQSIRKMLSGYGYYLQGAAFARHRLGTLILKCSHDFHNGERVIVNLSKSASYGTYLPIIPVKTDIGIFYQLQYPEDMLYYRCGEVWIAWEDGQDHSIVPRRKSTRKAAVRENRTQDNDALHVYNENPNDNLIGDCAVRALAGVLEISWEEAVRRLAAAQDYTATVINMEQNIDAALEKEGFQRFDGIKRGKQFMTGWEFCEHIHDMFQAGTRLYAYFGHTHAAAILVFDNDYKIVDTWDSTNCRITSCWAKYPERPTRRPKPEADKLTELAVGMQIRHQVYGTGEIIALTDTVADVRFQNQTEKKLAPAWILANCKPV